MVDDFESKGADGKVTGVFVGVCGPAGLVENAWEAAAGVEDGVKRKIGGVEVHEECVFIVFLV